MQQVSPGTLDEVRDVLVETLALEDMRGELTASTELLGSLPSLDSMSVVMLLTALSERFGFDLEDAEISGEAFETLGSLTAFVEGLRTT
jgi:acyl carrier protein